MRIRLIAPVFLLLACMTLVGLPHAFAHEHRIVIMANQQVDFVVGWAVEPAYVDQQNFVDLRASLARTGTPVSGLEKVLQVEVSTGGKKIVLNLEPAFNRIGAYVANIIPTVPGTYAFRFFGNVNGTSVDERFECSEKTFDCVTDVAGIQFPEKTPSGRAVQLGLQDLQSKISQLQDALKYVYVIGLSGIIIGVAGLIVGVAAVRRGKKIQ